MKPGFLILLSIVTLSYVASISAQFPCDSSLNSAPNFTKISSSLVLSSELKAGAITRNDWPGFYEDFLVIHALIRKYKPANLFEIGTCLGTGTLIIKNAIGNPTVYSLDLPPNVQKEYHFLNERTTGSSCYLPYVQLFGDSLTYNYSQHYPIDSWFIDGQHDYQHVYHESLQAIQSGARLIIWHDTDLPEVLSGLMDAFLSTECYDIYRVEDTRVTYAVKHQIDQEK